jgi:uroporphyrinogen III methyltransferase/synthase
LAEVPEVIARERLRPPVVVIVGEVVGVTEAASWFEQRPLMGKRVLVTRPADQASSLQVPLEELGAEVLVQPAIEISPPDDWSPVDAALARLCEFDWLVFSSANGVRFLLERLEATGNDLRRLGSLKLAVIGPGTAEELSRYHLKADLQPSQYRAELLAEALVPEARGRRFLLVRASRGREVLREQLSAAGAFVEQVVVYQSRDLASPASEIAEALRAGRINWVTVTSSAIARSLVGLFGDDLRRARLVSISPITSGTLRGLGHEPAAEAAEYTMPGIVAAILADR